MKILSREASNQTHDADVLVVRSEAAGVDFRITVAGPGAPLPPGVRLDVVYGLDGDLLGGANISAARGNLVGGAQPPLFVVNIGYPAEAGPTAWMMRRVRELSPYAREDFRPLIARQMPGAPETGGGQAFLQFLTEELKPLIEASYPVNPGPAGILGASMGGLFVLHALIAAPQHYNRVLCVSPARFWGGPQFEAALKAFVADTAPLKDARLYSCAGENEHEEDLQRMMQAIPSEEMRTASKDFFEHVGWPDLHKEALNAARDLQGRAGLTTQTRIFADEDHGSVYSVAVSQGLRGLYGARP